jgi:hypothetical protein
MFRFFRLWLGLLAGCFRSHRTLLLENLALRQQLTLLKRRHPKPKLSPLDKLLGLRSAILVRLEKFSHHRHPGDRNPLAPCRLP